MTGKFTFAEAKEGFDNHIDKSIRGYSTLWNDILNLSQYFIEDDTCVVDIGCSTGKLLKEIAKQSSNFAKAKFIGIEIEPSFYPGFDKDEEANLLSGKFTPTYIRDDVRNYTFKNSSLITSIFTLQFMPQFTRDQVLESIYEGLNAGGAFIFAEKTLAECAKIQDIMTFTYYDHKRQNFTEKEILDKEKELRHMLKPVTEWDIYTDLEIAGFDVGNVECFWKNYLFGAWIAIK